LFRRVERFVELRDLRARTREACVSYVVLIGRNFAADLVKLS
jgi:hypothetical protein